MIEKSLTIENATITLPSILSCPHCGQSSEEIIPPDM